MNRVISLATHGDFTMTDLLSLPPELLTRILEEVPGKDLLNVCTSCKQLRDIVYVDSVWQRKCEEGKCARDSSFVYIMYGDPYLQKL